MAKFCGKCGSLLNDTSLFCGGCGSPVVAAQAPVQTNNTVAMQPPQAFTPVAGYAPGPIAVAAPVKKSNTLLKVIVVCVAFLVVGVALALAGLWYGARSIKEKADAAARQSPELASIVGAVGGLAKSVASDDGPAEFQGNPCRLLSTQEVSQAIGVTVIRAEGDDAGCSYIARGDPADMTARHATSMTSGLVGSAMDAKSQKILQSFASGLFAQQEAQDKALSAQAAKGEVPVLVVGFTVGNAEAQMKLNRSSFQHISGGAAGVARSGTGDLDGIGDEAYLAGGSMILVRKGETIARFMYTACPCNTDNIKPLARLAASRL